MATLSEEAIGRYHAGVKLSHSLRHAEIPNELHIVGVRALDRRAPCASGRLLWGAVLSAPVAVAHLCFSALPSTTWEVD